MVITRSQCKQSGEECNHELKMAGDRTVTISNRVPSLPLEKFYGRPSDDTEAQVEQFKVMKNIYSWKDPEARSFFVGILDGPAKDYYYTNRAELDTIERFDDFIKKFQEHLPSSNADPYSALFSRKKLDTESSSEYFYAVMRLCQRADPKMSETQKIQHILKGLGPQILEYLTQRDCKTVDEVLTQMALYEKARYQSNVRAIDNSIKSSVAEPTNSSVQETPLYRKRRRFPGPRKFNIVKQMRNLRISERKDPIVCYQCGKVGHIRRECYSNPANRSRRPPTYENQNRQRSYNQNSKVRNQTRFAPRRENQQQNTSRKEETN